MKLQPSWPPFGAVWVSIDEAVASVAKDCPAFSLATIWSASAWEAVAMSLTQSTTKSGWLAA